MKQLNWTLAQNTDAAAGDLCSPCGRLFVIVVPKWTAGSCLFGLAAH